MTPSLKNISLKTRMALSVSLLFVAFGAIMAYFTLSYFERKYDETISNQQFALVSALAFGIDNKLRLTQNALLAAASRVTPAIARDPAKARRYLDDRPTLTALFDDGVFLISKEGEVIAESSGRPHRQGGDKPFREVCRKALAAGKPYFSNHYISTHLPGNPAVLMTAPLFDSRGEIYAMLGGSIDLFGKNLLEELSRVRIGNAGYIFLSDHQDRTVIFHPDRKRILEKIPEGANKLFDRAVAGFEGSGKTVNSRGARMLTSFKHLASNDWIVGANLPQDEAYAPLYRARHYFIMGMSAATAVILVIAWLLTRRLTSPLMTITRHVQTMQKKSGRERLIGIDTGDEIGTLAKAFNGMILSIEMQRKELEAFSYSLSHDLKTPLTRISIAAQCLAEEYAGKLDETGKFFVDNIGTACDRMDELLDAMLVLSRLTRRELRSERIDLSELALKVLLGLRAAHPERQVEYDIAAGLTAWGDRNMIETALENLLGNAWKYTGKRAAARIEFGATEINGERAFFVRDNGAGFDMGHAERLFQPFQRLHREEEFEGTGIGLATVQRIMERHGGRIWAEGEPGNGATFYFTLPGPGAS